MVRKPKAQGVPAADKRQAMLRAAEGVFRNRRYHEVTLDEIAAQAGVGKGTIYLYFRDKDDLFFQMVTQGFDDLCAGLTATAHSPLPVREKFYTIFGTMADFFASRHSMRRFLHFQEQFHKGQGMHQRLHQQRERLEAILSGVFDEARREGLIRPGLSFEVLDCLLQGATRARGARLAMHGRNVPVRELVDVILDGATPRAAAAPATAEPSKRGRKRA